MCLWGGGVRHPKNEPRSIDCWGSLIRFALILTIAVNFVAQPVVAQTTTVTLTRGPYLQMRSTTSILVRWRTDQPADSLVQCGTQLSNLDMSFFDQVLTTEHQVLLTNLTPQTKYYYAVATSSGGLSGMDGAFVAGGTSNFFVTAPPVGVARPTRIWFVSDYGFQNNGEIAVRDSYFNYTAATRPADVWLTGGDNDQNVGADADVQNSVFGIYAPLLRNLAIWPAMGNHDTYSYSNPGPYPFFDNFSLPTNGEAGGTPSGSEHYYSYDYGDVHFISLDSITPELSNSTNSPMLQWLRQDLARTTRKWKIAYWHGPPYTKGSHDSDSPYDLSARMIQMRENAVPILESYGVDLVLCGHSHVYERSYLLYGHYGYSWEFSETNKVNGGNGRVDGTGAYQQTNGHGTVYVVAALGGSPYSFYNPTHPAHLVNISGELGSCMVDVNDNRLDFKFINANTNVLDHFTLIKGPPATWRILTMNRSGTATQLRWASIPGRYYRIYGQSELGGGWTLVADQLPSQGDTTAWSATWNSGAKMGFFRVATCPE